MSANAPRQTYVYAINTVFFGSNILCNHGHILNSFSWPVGHLRRNALKPQIAQIMLVNKYIDHTDRVVFSDTVIKSLKE